MRYIPSNYRESAPRWPQSDSPDRKVDEVGDMLPDDYGEAYDMHEVIKALVDDGEYFEIKDEYAPNLICCFCRFDGRTVGLVANNPIHPGSTLEVNTCDKYYRFLQVLEAYNIPLVNLVDTPPAVPGEGEEARGLIRHVGKILNLYATTTVPKISVVLRHSYADAGSLVMGGLKGMGADLTYAWPTGRFAVEASTLDYREVLGDCVEADAYESYWKWSREAWDAFETAYSWTAQIVDEVILPGDTRKKIIRALQVTENKKERLPTRKKAHESSPT